MSSNTKCKPCQSESESEKHSRKSHKKHSKKSDSCSSDDDKKYKKKHSKKHDSEESECSDRKERRRPHRKSESEDSECSDRKERRRPHRRHHRKSESSDSESSDSECSDKKEKRRHKKCDEGKEEKCYSESSAEEFSKKDEKKWDNKCSSTSSSSSSSESDSEMKERKCHFNDLYNYYKYRMITDEELMVQGSKAYMYATNTLTETLPQEQAATLENIFANYNIDNLYTSSPFYVRKNGVYLVEFVINTDQAAQFCIFVNSEAQEISRCGTNSGSGQLLIKALLRLKENDAVIIRNDMSAIPTVTSTNYTGGLQVGNPSTLSIVYLAPYDFPVVKMDDCLDESEERLFCKLYNKLLSDPDLMLNGFSTHASIYSDVVQTVLPEESFVFNNSLNVHNVMVDPSNNLVIMEDGVYQVDFLVNTVLAGQVSLFVNGMPMENTTVGVNKGMSQISCWSLVELHKNDVLTLVNHTSANGNIQTYSMAGGPHNIFGVLLQLFKVAPLNKILPCYHNVNKYYTELYCKFKNYLLKKDNLLLTGSSDYINVVSSTKQLIANQQPFDWSIVNVQSNILHVNGSYSCTINKTGIYNVLYDIIANEPSQMSLFVNGVRDIHTTTGKNSGSSRNTMNQHIELNKGDVIEVRNDDSYVSNITPSINAGGLLPGNNRMFILFLLSNL